MEDSIEFVEMEVKEEPMDHQGSSSHSPSSSGVEGVRHPDRDGYLIIDPSDDLKKEVKEEPFEDHSYATLPTSSSRQTSGRGDLRNHSGDVKEEDVWVKDEPIEEVDPIAVNTTTFTPKPENTWTEDSAQHESNTHSAEGSTAQEPATDQDDSGSDTDEAAELEVELVQKKYKSLRDQFRKELKTAPAGKSGDPGLAREEYTSRWKYFNLFFFLRDDMIGRKSSGNTTAAAAALQGVPQETQESTDSASTDNTPLLSPLSPEAGPSSVIPCPSPSPSISTPSSQTPSFRDQESQQKLGGMAKKKRVTALNKDPGWFSLEETKVDLLRKIAGGQDDSEDIDEDKMFLLSLLPSLRKLPRDQAWDLKIKFAQLLKEELVKTTSTPSQGTLSYQPDATSQGPYSRQDAPSYQPYATSQSHYSRQDAPSYQPDATSQSHYSRQDAPSYQPDATSQGPNSRQDAPSYQPDATSPGSYYQLTSPMNNI